MKTPLNYLLFNMAVTDIMIGVFSIPMFVFNFISQEVESIAEVLLCKFIVHGTLIYLCGTVSVFSLGAIAFERYQAVVHPLTVKEIITKKKTLAFIAITWILVVCANLPWFFGLDLDDSFPRKCRIKTEYEVVLKLQSYFFEVFASAVPLVVMIILYGKVIWEITKKQNQIIEQNQQAAFQTKKRITAMLITVTLIFATLWVAALVFQIKYGYKPGNVTATVIAFLLLINSSINWVLYALFSKHFRNCFKRALCSCSKTQEPSGGYPRVKENPIRNGVVDTRL